MGYQNHQHFLQFAFHGGLWMSAHCLFIFFHMEAIDFSAGDYMFFASGWVLAAFAWVVFFMYSGLALKGLTIIEAAERFQLRRAQVLAAHQPHSSEPRGLKLIGNQSADDNFLVIFGVKSFWAAMLPIRRRLPSPDSYLD